MIILVFIGFFVTSLPSLLIAGMLYYALGQGVLGGLVGIVIIVSSIVLAKADDCTHDMPLLLIPSFIGLGIYSIIMLFKEII
jgi:hypothetical protein